MTDLLLGELLWTRSEGLVGDTASGSSIALGAPPAAATALAFDVMVVGR